MAIELNLSECTFNNDDSDSGYSDPSKRMVHLYTTLTHPSLGVLATARCIRIQYRIKFKNYGDFLEMMDDESRELNEFSVALFDKYSNVRPWLVDGGAKSGSGCWGMELSVGDMLYIDELTVKKEV